MCTLCVKSSSFINPSVFPNQKVISNVPPVPSWTHVEILNLSNFSGTFLQTIFSSRYIKIYVIFNLISVTFSRSSSWSSYPNEYDVPWHQLMQVWENCRFQLDLLLPNLFEGWNSLPIFRLFSKAQFQFPDHQQTESRNEERSAHYHDVWRLSYSLLSSVLVKQSFQTHFGINCKRAHDKI